MSIARNLRGWFYGIVAILLSSCAVIPIPASKDTVVSGHAIVKDELQSVVSVGESSRVIKARLGEPVVDFGPGRVFVYQWTIKKGKIVWFLLGAGAALGDIEPWTTSHLLIIAFNAKGNVLKAGTMDFKPLDSIGEHVHTWLSSVDLVNYLLSPDPLKSVMGEQLVYIYRPSTSLCDFPTFDSSIFMPSVAINDSVIGDLPKGSYLAVNINEGKHNIVIDPYPAYRILGKEESSFVQDTLRNKIPTTVNITNKTDRPTFIETYLCTGMGKTKMYAEIRDHQMALEAISKLKPAW